MSRKNKNYLAKKELRMYNGKNMKKGFEKMAVTTIIKQIKKIYPNDVVLVRIGKFFHVYGKDSYVLAYMFGYKIREIEEGIKTSGFPESCEAKVRAGLEKKKINYLIVDRRNDYEVEEISNNKNLNTYQEVFEKAHEYINLKDRVDKIYRYLTKNLLKPEIRKKISEIEEMINK